MWRPNWEWWEQLTLVLFKEEWNLIRASLSLVLRSILREWQSGICPQTRPADEGLSSGSFRTLLRKMALKGRRPAANRHLQNDWKASLSLGESQCSGSLRLFSKSLCVIWFVCSLLGCPNLSSVNRTSSSSSEVACKDFEPLDVDVKFETGANQSTFFNI